VVLLPKSEIIERMGEEKKKGSREGGEDRRKRRGEDSRRKRKERGERREERGERREEREEGKAVLLLSIFACNFSKEDAMIRVVRTKKGKERKKGGLQESLRGEAQF